ncbi:uncharacterized protein BYT42DRAFT_553726 [Radiomyces spectabilis]|uniref:uncharacterized protein n=1 Tax=Radiomyces spectabilis TaxID=64574 RepID=UPI00221E6845|nr:uncharacterized protein BYT42DRAFT_553726 [Radiomyces spectabilis]KAI8394217.1 hypothetical protein BYT42DRAFT_553726 [Radiomyces spectabilis]
MHRSQPPTPQATADTGFLQDPPQLINQYDDDLVLKNILKRLLPEDVLRTIEPDLHQFGERVINDIAAMGDNVEDPNNHPRLKQYDAWCRRVDEITVAQGWKDLNDVAAEEGLIAIAYERKFQEYSRIYQFAKQYLYMPSSAMYSCPLSMTDGAARVLELIGTDEMKKKYFTRLTSRDPKKFWTSGQWMTERPGGSDVGRTETQAESIDPQNNKWSVSGFKWFSSATTADMTMLLARTIDPQTNTVVQGSKGLSLYLAEMRRTDGSLNGVQVHRLKNKYGTKGLPTAELQLSGMEAYMLGRPGRGVPNIASILNITRIYAALGVVTGLRRSLAIAKSFASRRQAFGKQLDKLPLHVATLAELEIILRATSQISFYAVALLGRTECLPDNDERKEDFQMLRFVTPVAKAYVCKIGLNACSEAMEALGGQGYMEEIGVARLLRDAQVNTIWEGTTNVLAMDVLRVLRETKGQALQHFKKVLSQKVADALNISQDRLKGAAAKIQQAFTIIDRFIQNAKSQLPMEVGARQLTFALGRVLAAVLLLEQAAWAIQTGNSNCESDLIAVNRWCNDPAFLKDIITATDISVKEDAVIVFGSHSKL